MATLTSTGVNFSDGTTINGTAKNTIGSIFFGYVSSNQGTMQPGANAAGSSFRCYTFVWDSCAGSYSYVNSAYNPSLTGTWQQRGSFSATTTGSSTTMLFVRIS
jgi:hypothetical protein